MKQIPEELSARLASEAPTLCLCWRLTRRDGLVIGVSDHDHVLQVAGIFYAPGAAVEAGKFTQSADLKPGRGAAAGVLSSDAITEEDLSAGLWDGARVDVFRVDWTAPELGGVVVWSGYLSELSYGAQGGFEAELVSLKADLEHPVGRVLQRQCDAVLGDARCGIEVLGRTCDKRFETCRDVFGNTENFRGFPHMPGTDFILSGPAADRNDGGRR